MEDKKVNIILGVILATFAGLLILYFAMNNETDEQTIDNEPIVENIWSSTDEPLEIIKESMDDEYEFQIENNGFENQYTIYQIDPETGSSNRMFIVNLELGEIIEIDQ